MNNRIQQIINEISKVLRGKNQSVEYVLLAVLAGGHVLLEDIPGVGKTTLAVALSRTMSFSYRRMQFTPDILPSDILGFNMPDPTTGKMVFHPGAVFTNLFLADEVNRTSPKSQSALLEVMEEGRATVDGQTYLLKQPFFVIATQNPTGSVGTQKLPDSQLDRFMIRISLGYPDPVAEMQMLGGRSYSNMSQVQPVLKAEELLSMQEQVQKIHVSEPICRYIINLVSRTREHTSCVQGVSPRGSLALLKMAKASAYSQERDYVTPEDIRNVFYPTFGHRIMLGSHAYTDGKTEMDILSELIHTEPIPGLHGM